MELIEQGHKVVADFNGKHHDASLPGLYQHVCAQTQLFNQFSYWSPFMSTSYKPWCSK